ncbi:MAG: hypothetical protein JWP27_975 [Flaviaesturariibacter sp.]|nr:hypothetical protein [Flaviaesturariibacter sp.]
MKKQLLLCFLLPLFAFATIDWVNVQLDDHVTVSFPEKPTDTDMKGNDVKILDIGTDARCMSMIIDFEKMGVTAEQIAEEMKGEAAFENFRNSMVAQINGGKVIAEKNTMEQGYPCFEYTINMGPDSQYGTMYTRNIFVGGKLYTLSFFEKKEKPKAETRERFLSSIKIKK